VVPFYTIACNIFEIFEKSNILWQTLANKLSYILHTVTKNISEILAIGVVRAFRQCKTWSDILYVCNTSLFALWNAQYCTISTTVHHSSVCGRHVRQLSGNGREDGQKGEDRREKSWDSEIIIDNQQKEEFASRASKREVTILRQGEPRKTRQGDRAEQKRTDREALKTTIRYCLVMLDLPSDKRRRTYTT
jgi:hypothetical protein